MNRSMLKLVHQNLEGWIAKSNQGQVRIEQKLNVIMQSLADMCMALGTNGTQESANRWYADSTKALDSDEDSHA